MKISEEKISEEQIKKVHKYVCKKYGIWAFCPYFVQKDNAKYCVIGYRKENIISVVFAADKENSSFAYHYHIRLTIDDKIDPYSITSIDILDQIIRQSKKYAMKINGYVFPKGATWESLAIEADLNC